MLARCAATTSGRACLLRHRLAVCRFPPARSFRRLLCQASATNLASRRCEPCEEAKGPLDSMGLSMAIDRAAAEELINELDNWRVFEDSLGQLRIRKKWRTKNFVKGLELCKRIGDVAEAEGHHPDLHLVGWNNLTVEVWTHSRGGLSENDFILAAKIDELGKDDLLSKKQPSQDD